MKEALTNSYGAIIPSAGSVTSAVAETLRNAVEIHRIGNAAISVVKPENRAQVFSCLAIRERDTKKRGTAAALAGAVPL